MKVGRVIKWTALGLVLAILLVAGVLYYLASRVPDLYRPAELASQQRRQIAEQTFPKDVGRFNNIIQSGARGEYTIEQARINEYLASMDEIAAMERNVKQGTVHRAMTKMGLADPAVALHDGLITMMIRSTEHDKVLSVDLKLEVRQQMLHVDLTDVRLGDLSLPQSLVRDQLEQLRSSLPDAPDDNSGQTQSLVLLMRAILDAALDGRALGTLFAWDRRQVQVTNVVVDDGSLTLWLEPQGFVHH